MEDRPPALYATVTKKPKLPFGCFVVVLLLFVIGAVIGILYALDRDGALQDAVKRQLGKYIPSLAPPVKKKEKAPGPMESIKGSSSELKAATEKNPADYDAWANYGYALEREGKQAEATRAFTLATQYNMIAGAPWVELARHHLRQGRKEDAAKANIKGFENADKRDLSKINPKDQAYVMANYELQFAIALLDPLEAAPAAAPTPAAAATPATPSASIAGLPPVSGSAPKPTAAPAATPAASPAASPATPAASPATSPAAPAIPGASPAAPAATPAAAPAATPSPAAQRFIAAIKARDDSQKDMGGVVKLFWDAGKADFTIPYLEAVTRLEPTNLRAKEILIEGLEKAGKPEEAAAVKAKMVPTTAPVADPRAK